MKTMKRTAQKFAAICMLLLGAGSMMVGCGEDDPVIPPDFGESLVTFLHANPGRVGNVAFFRSDTIQITTMTPKYGEFFNAMTPNGSSIKYLVKATDGTSLKSVRAEQDSGKVTMVVFTGDANADEVFFAASTKGNTGTNAAVRFVHAAKDAGTRDLRIGDPAGAAISSNLSYKGASGAYISVSTNTDTLWIVDPADAANNIAIPVTLTAGLGYSIVFHGSEGAIDPALQWQGLIIADPS